MLNRSLRSVSPYRGKQSVAHNRYQLNSATQFISLQVGNANRRHIAKIRCRCANSIRVYRLLPLASRLSPPGRPTGCGNRADDARYIYRYQLFNIISITSSERAELRSLAAHTPREFCTCTAPLLLRSLNL